MTVAPVRRTMSAVEARRPTPLRARSRAAGDAARCHARAPRAQKRAPPRDSRSTARTRAGRGTSPHLEQCGASAAASRARPAGGEGSSASRAAPWLSGTTGLPVKFACHVEARFRIASDAATRRPTGRRSTDAWSKTPGSTPSFHSYVEGGASSGRRLGDERVDPPNVLLCQDRPRGEVGALLIAAGSITDLALDGTSSAARVSISAAVQPATPRSRRDRGHRTDQLGEARTKRPPVADAGLAEAVDGRSRVLKGHGQPVVDPLEVLFTAPLDVPDPAEMGREAQRVGELGSAPFPSDHFADDVNVPPVPLRERQVAAAEGCRTIGSRSGRSRSGTRRPRRRSRGASRRGAAPQVRIRVQRAATFAGDDPVDQRVALAVLGSAPERFRPRSPYRAILFRSRHIRQTVSLPDQFPLRTTFSVSPNRLSPTGRACRISQVPTWGAAEPVAGTRAPACARDCAWRSRRELVAAVRGLPDV